MNDINIKNIDIDIKGQRVYNCDYNFSFVTIDISNLNSGLYIISIMKDDNSMINDKVYVE